MKRRVAVIGLGRLGKACGGAIGASEAGSCRIVRRPKNLSPPLPQTLRDVPIARHTSELGTFDLALICLPTPPLVLEVATVCSSTAYRWSNTSLCYA